MENVIVELTTMIARAEPDVVERTILEPVRPGEKILGTLDLQGRAVCAAENVARMSLNAYVKANGGYMNGGVLTIALGSPREWLKHYTAMKAKVDLLHALLIFLIAKTIPSENLFRMIAIRKGFVIVDASETQRNEELLAEAEEFAKANDLKPQ